MLGLVPSYEPNGRTRWLADRPVRAIQGLQSAKWLPAAFEELSERVKEQALAEASRAGEEMAGALIGHRQSVSGPVDVAATSSPTLRKR